MTKCIVFPGQGSQYLGMGKYLNENFDVSRRVFDEVDNALNQNLSRVIFGEDINKLNLTENTQPAIMAVSIATFEALKKEKGICINNFDFCAGHSLGEYSALVASESIKLSDAAKILKKRGQAMQSAVPIGEGSMAAVLNTDIDNLEKFILEKKFQTIEISNDNCPGQCVISGAKQEIDKMVISLKVELKKKSILLPVSAPFHCKMMKPAAEELKNYIEDFHFKDPKIPLVSNVSTKAENLNNEIKNLLIKCVYSRVKWRDTVKFFSNNKISKAVECGPGKALTNMFKRFDFEIKCLKIDNLEDIKNYE
ncbi:MAG: ACP S-malonyltransferase [Pelagibacteraceae bacterium]|nr:ACP S-malonyltransferase [Pelagibacteraceae bacterium]MCI5079018.1 ACP S-malonyltransferase [Pelagibacteraceae bacterium]